MKDYVFYVNICGGSAGGTYTVKEKDFVAAYERALEEIGKKLYEAFPELEIDYDIEPVYEYEE